MNKGILVIIILPLVVIIFLFFKRKNSTRANNLLHTHVTIPLAGLLIIFIAFYSFRVLNGEINKPTRSNFPVQRIAHAWGGIN
jgi:ABC-type transport system involved in multi-copper enzyme maturation permease subunit